MRAANYPLTIASGVEITLKGQEITAKGPKGSLSETINPVVKVTQTDEGLMFSTQDTQNHKHLGTWRALISNMITGVSQGFTKVLLLVGVGYRAQVKGNALELALGFSHPVTHAIPDGISVSVEKNTRIIISGHEKQKVGQFAADIRAYRPVEPYKGKGVRYENEEVIRKEAKKK